MSKYLKLFGAVTIWAVINGLVVKGVKADPTAIGFWMGLIGATILGCRFLYLILVKEENPFAGIGLKQILLLTGLGIAAGTNNVFFYIALKHKVANTALVHYLAQPLSLFFLVFFLKEKILKIHYLAVPCGLAGAAVLAWEGGRFSPDKWLIFAFLSAVFYAGEITFSKALGKQGVSPNLSACSKLSFQMLIMLVGGKILGHTLAVGNGEGWKIFVAGILLYLSFIWLFDALKDSPGKKDAVSGTNFGIIGYVDRLGAVAFGIIFFHEAHGYNVIAGGILIVLAQAIVIFGQEKESPPSIVPVKT